MDIERLLDDFARFLCREKRPVTEAIEMAIWEQEVPTTKTRIFLTGFHMGILEYEKGRRAAEKEKDTC